MVAESLGQAYVRQSGRLWRILPAFLRSLPVGLAYGRHLHAFVLRYADRNQNHSTFFLRNRPELELMQRLLSQRPQGDVVDIAVVACSKGAEVYSILWMIHAARPDLQVRIRAVDISQEVVDFAAAGIYSLNGVETGRVSLLKPGAQAGDMTWTDQIWGGQPFSMFERMTTLELHGMFEVEGKRARIKSSLKDRITWLRGDATNPEFAVVLGLQDIVVANRFLCHMKPDAAETCLRNVARLVKKGGYLFVSGVDLDVRMRVAKDLGWHPVQDMIKEVHEGDPSLTQSWPLSYSAVEPFRQDRTDWQVYFASVFQID